MKTPEHQNTIFPKGEKGPAEYFTGPAWVNILVPQDETGSYAVGNVVFEPGCRNNIAAALPYMKQQKSGHFINVSSVAGHKVTHAGAVYAATKHAVRALSEGLRQEVKPYNIRTTVISPGAVATELPDSITEQDVSKDIHEFYEKVAIPADSFARIVAFAISQPEDVDINEVLYRPTRQEL